MFQGPLCFAIDSCTCDRTDSACRNWLVLVSFVLIITRHATAAIRKIVAGKNMAWSHRGVFALRQQPASPTSHPLHVAVSVFGTMGMFRGIQVLVLVVVVAIGPLEASASSGARRMSVPANEVALTQPASFASNWFHTMMPAIGNGTLLDLCLPGTHDSMTWVVRCMARRWCGCGLMVAHLVIRYDLSTTVADNANDLNPTIAWLLHELKDFADIGKFVREFVRNLSPTPLASSSRCSLLPPTLTLWQAKTQGLNITQQLDAGIRYIDFRITYTAGPDSSSACTSRAPPQVLQPTL